MPNISPMDTGGIPGAPHTGAQRFAERYFLADDDQQIDNYDWKNDPKNPNRQPSNTAVTPSSVTMPDTPGAPVGPNQGPNYKPISGPNSPAGGPGAQPINMPRGAPAIPNPPGSANAFGRPLPTEPLHPAENNAMDPENAAATPGPGGASAVRGTSTDNPTKGKPLGLEGPGSGPGQQGAPGEIGGGMGGGLGQAMQIAEPLISGIGGALSGIPVIGPAISGIANGLGGALSGLHLGNIDAERYAAIYMQGEADFLGQGGPDWMDFPFSGSGPDRQDWSTTSEDYVNEHERPKRQETWRTDNDGDIVKYTDRLTQPKQSHRQVHADMLSGDAGYGGGPGPEVGGATLSPSASGMGLGGSFSEPASSSGTPTMGQLTNTAALNDSARRFWADAVDKTDRGYYNPSNRPYQEYDKGNDGLDDVTDDGDDSDDDQNGHGKKKNGPSMPGLPKIPGLGGGGSAGEAAGVGGEAAELAPLALAAARYDGSDVVRQFQSSTVAQDLMRGGSRGGGLYSDDATAVQAQKFLKTAGRNYTLAEQRELEDEFHPRGARNLGDLDLAGTHYVD
jgi:hypothetical protein